MKKWLVPVAAILVLLTVVAWMAGIFRERIEPGVAPMFPVDSEAAVAAVEEVTPYSEAVPASIEAKEATIISSRLLARITSIEVRAGDYVEEGDLLISLEQEDLQARVSQARNRVRSVEARLTEARQNLARAEELHERGLLAIADRDAASADAASLEADLSSARQTLQEANAALAFSEIRSPIDGRVVDRFAEPGDTASPGNKLLSLYNPFSLRVEGQVREELALSLETRQPLEVDVPALKKTLSARIEEIVPAADPGSRTFLVKAGLPTEENLLPGMYARMRVPAGERSRLLIPSERVARVGQLDVVWVAREDGVVRRFVRLGQPWGDGMVEVVAGLAPGDAVLPIPADP